MNSHNQAPDPGFFRDISGVGKHPPYAAIIDVDGNILYDNPELEKWLGTSTEPTFSNRHIRSLLSPEEATYLRNPAIGDAQGFLFGRPHCARKFEQTHLVGTGMVSGLPCSGKKPLLRGHQ